MIKSAAKLRCRGALTRVYPLKFENMSYSNKFKANNLIYSLVALLQFIVTSAHIFSHTGSLKYLFIGS